MNAFTIGTVARRAGVGIDTVRFYERRGLLDKPPRSPSGYRLFPPDTVARIRFIKRAQQLGFSLREIRELLELRVDPETTCEDIRRKAQAKIEDIDRKIEELRRMKTALKRLYADCRKTEGPISACPILDAMEDPMET